MHRSAWRSPWVWGLALPAALWVWSLLEVRHGPGPVAPGRPAQAPLEGRRPIEHGDALLLPRALYQVEARVLASERYRIDPMADLAPHDLALGWGPMSDERVLEHVYVDQAHRRAYTRTEPGLPIPGRLMSLTFTNVHVIPATREVSRAVARLRRGDVVRLEGLLVDVERGGSTWKTSLIRHDYGDGACEILYLMRLGRRPRPRLALP